MCVTTVVYLINRLPSASLQGKSPYETIYAKLPSFAHLRIIGCLCYATVILKGDKFAERAKSAVLMGYSERQKGYILIELLQNSSLLAKM